MDRDDIKKSIICYVLIALVVVGGIWLGFFLTRKNNEHEKLHENTSTTAVVKDKYIREFNHVVFWVTAEHEAINSDGEEIKVSRTYSVPMEDYFLIEVGDTIATGYEKPGLWWYIGFDKAEGTGDKVCGHCGAVVGTAWCGYCGTKMD